jgi:GMP synthase-like glutamine amidotransferase
VLSGGPSSVYEDEVPLSDKRLLESGLPLLGIKQYRAPRLSPKCPS